MEFCSCMKKIFPEYLKDILEEDFLLLDKYLDIKEYKAHQILKHPNETESVSRLVLSGFGVTMEMDEEGEYKVDRVYKQGEILMDSFSYKFNRPTKSLIKSYSVIKVAELTKEAEKSLLEDHPQLNALSAVINYHILLIEKSWIKILNAPLGHRHEMFLHNFKIVSNHISIIDLAHLLKMGYSTLKDKRRKAADKIAMERLKQKEKYKINPLDIKVYSYSSID